MSEEINIDANNLSITEDTFEEFQSSAFKEEDYITLSDIVPPQPPVPDHSQELNEIPYDNEVVLGSPQNDEGQVNSRNDNAPEFLDISENNAYNDYQLDTDGGGYSNDDLSKDLDMIKSETPYKSQCQDLSSDGLGAQNYVIEDSEAIIQDSFLSTTVGQSDLSYETSSEVPNSGGYSRRTKRGRIPNTAKYPITSVTKTPKNTIEKRRPGRPKKVPLVQTVSEPDSTNIDSSSLFAENGNVTDGSSLDESVSNNIRKGRRGRPRKEDSAPTPSKRGRKPKVITIVNEEHVTIVNNSLKISENSDCKKQNIDSQTDQDLSLPKSEAYSLTLSTSKRKKKGTTKGKKISLESANILENTSGENNSDLDDVDDVCLSKLKQSKAEIISIQNSTDVAIPVANVQYDAEKNPIETATEANPNDNIQTELEAEQINLIQNGTTTILTDDGQNIDTQEISSSLKRNSKMPFMSDFEYNLDKAVKEATVDEQTNVSVDNECLLVEDTSKRRRTAKKMFVYDEGSDEDPFANVESSDDEPRRRKKGNKYNSDDEYVPSVDGRKRGRGKIRSSSSESDEFHDDLDEMTKTKKKYLGLSPKKGIKPLGNKSLASNVTTIPIEAKSLVSTITPKAADDDIEGCLQTTMIKVDESLKPPAEAWATSNEFENFIAKKTHGTSLKIKKVSSKEVTESLAPLDIPVVQQNMSKKAVEISTQTKKTSTSCISVQTSAPYDIPMKSNIDLTAAQSEKACEFLSSVVKTTVELGQLMSQKSDDFMKKKINTMHVTDTMKMDYCVRKSFLLFKLAKHNLLQMEDDLANQYDAFLKEHNLSSCRDQPKKITPKVKPVDSDSDCEIIEVVGASGSGTKDNTSKFNTKTVFLNKELSIKIAKKPNTPVKPAPGKKKLDIKGRHAVWINKNVMVKKVTPTQSFLAQDSRNKKPPDYITEKMVSDFFEGYNRKKALFVCAPFINTSWTSVQRVYACHYFMNELDAANTSYGDNVLNASPIENNNETPEISDETSNFKEITNFDNTKSLFSLCIEVIRKCSLIKNDQAQATQNLTCNVTDGTPTKKPVTLFRLCVDSLRAALNQNKTQEDSDIVESHNLLGLPDQNNIESTQDITEEMEYCSDQYNVQDNVIDSTLCVTPWEYNAQVTEDSPIQAAVLPLTRICYIKIVKLLSASGTFTKIWPTMIPEEVTCNNVISMNNYYNIDEDDILDQEECLSLCSSGGEDSPSDESLHITNETKSLLSLCVEFIQSLHRPETSASHSNACECKSLKSIAFENIKQILYQSDSEHQFERSLNEPAFEVETNNECEANENFIINCVNTLSEEAFQSLQVPLKIRIRKQSRNSSNFSDGLDDDYCGDPNEFDINADNEEDDNGWASQLQMQEFRSCFAPNVDTTENITNKNNETKEALHVSQIKSEPVDYFPEENIDTSIVKTEPQQELHTSNEMTHVPDSIITKNELVEATNDTDSSPLIQSTSSYNVESFEQFVRSNKMIRSMDEPNDEIFSQSGLRIRRQHEPDLDQDHDTSMSLLVPHTFEPLNLVEAKGVLMESSSDDNGSFRKNTGKKKDKRKKKNKKDAKVVSSKETLISKEKPVSENEVAILTRKMRDKIRQEEKKIESSDSESENLLTLTSKKDKSKKDKIGPEEKNKHSKDNKQKNYDVQCNNVDSTEKLTDNSVTHKASDNFSGFTAIDQNEITNYHKLMQFVYDKIIPSNNETIDKNQIEDVHEEVNDTGPVFHSDEPVELLECEPTIPMFGDKPNKHSAPRTSKNISNDKLEIDKVNPKFTNRHGWHCYPIDSNETKLYKNAQILLEKLPESFVDTYMEYQDVMDKDLDDQEVDRLTNLQSLNRSISIKDIKDGKSKVRPKGASKESSNSGRNSANISRSPSPTYSDNFDELAPSDEEGPAVEDEIPPPMPVRSSENNLAKNLLMDDHDSDSESENKIKQELRDPDEKKEKPGKPGPKSKTRADKDSESLMLTADKMMNKELTLLHAPIMLQEPRKEITVKENISKEETKTSKKSSTKHSKERVKNDDDSSSEEEKQWVSTKEKLLKRMGKKEDAIADDAKRVKLVNEFIERRNELERKNKRESGTGRKGRARRKMLERQKQLRFLSNELYYDGDGVVTGKRGAAAGLFKGRRNIRKVIDKKSLARSTVVANMEEFERKRRLNMRQNKLREVLGCEEGVNVLVINDEVCLEYDFEEQRPVVAVHQFFTKVMKTHQYEGVKFMWDACFESLGMIESGHGGGGCILAHCMGLGKTLQVLALLHTVLTHPRANMHRVLVCCPLSTVLNWVDEIHKWIGPVTHEIKVFELSKLRKTYERAYQLEDWYSGGGIFIIGYELFRSLTTLDPEIDEIRPTIINKIRTALLDPGPDIIVCDEGHLLKNDCSVLAVAMSRVVTKRRIVLTGTPMQNNLREYFCMVNFIKPNLLGTYSEYSNRFENPIMNGQHRDSREEDIKLMKARTHILHKVLEGCLQRQEASVLYPYLPKKHEYTVFIPLTQCQWDLYNHYMDNYAKTSKQSVLRDFHILQKIWSHPQVLHSFQMKARDKKDKIKAEKIEDDLALADQEADIKPAETEVWWLQYLGEGAMLNTLDSSNKFVAVFRILHECVSLGDKVLIFSTSLFCLDALEYFLKEINKWSLGQEYYRLDGSVPAEVRQKWCREFNAENNMQTKLFLISTRAGCLGLNMTAANRVIILDTSWNPAHDIQSIFRVYRFGQKKDCYIYRLVALGTMEQKIYERSVTKQAVACRVVDEQQIDRHYNLAELTELYSVDEMGLSVAGGVAVGVGDVALLRVARDAAIHAVHEHDSLLRGSGEQGLPEHERAAAWNQFQQEHEHKQMQNDISANKAVVALKRLEMEHLRQQALYSTTETPPVVVKIEQSTENHLLLVPQEKSIRGKKGKKDKSGKVVKCRIPIATSPQPGPSADIYENQQDMVQKITDLLIKHNFMQNQSDSRQISDLVTKVKRMVATGQPMALGPGYDELSSSIANVLLHKDVPMPALTDVERPPDVPEPETRKRSRPNKLIATESNTPAQTPPVEIPEQKNEGRTQRKAALLARMNFDSQHDVIDLDDDGDDWQNDTRTIEAEVEPELAPEPEKQKKKSTAKDDSSIVLSDDEPPPKVAAPTEPPTSVDNDEVALHPSLLTNSNFIKIVAHTYLAGNPMMDEDAATLAAQYSTLKTLKEAESEGKPILSGPVYDIAIQVLGKNVLRKLQEANPKTCGNSGSAPSMLSGGNAKPANSAAPNPPTPAAKKPKIGPKSKVIKDVKQASTPALTDNTKTQTKTMFTVNAISASGTTFIASNVSTSREESILPDEEVIISEPAERTPELPVDRKTIILRKVKLERKFLHKDATPAMPVRLGRGPAPQDTPSPAPSSSNETICLDSDEESTPVHAPPSTPRQHTLIQMPTMVPAQRLAPVPVALTGPNSRPLSIPSPALSSPSTLGLQPAFYTLSPCGTRAIRLNSIQPVPVSMSGPNGPFQPMPASFLNLGSQPVQMSFASPNDSQAHSTPRLQPVPVSLVGPNSQPIPISLSGPENQTVSMSYGAPASQHLQISLAESSGSSHSNTNHSVSSGLTLRFATQPVQSPQTSKTVSTPSASTSDPSHAQRLYRSNTSAVGSSKTLGKPSEVIQTPKVVDILNYKLGKSTSEVFTHTNTAPALRPIAPKLATMPIASTPVEAVSAATSRGGNQKEGGRRPTRRASSSSSSSSCRSRSSSPDPLAILKDVVHIQAPSKQTSAPQKATLQKPTPPQKSASKTLSGKSSSSESIIGFKISRNKTDTKTKEKQVKGIVDFREVILDSRNAKKQISGSVDLTDMPTKQGLRHSTRNDASKDRSTPRVDSSRKIGAFKIDYSTPAVKGKTNQSVPSKLVGTSKSIILDGKSKSLKVENKNAGPSILITSSKILPTTSKQKQADKRPSTSTSVPATKKKKTELMTLKDFDIDDIDDIIELD